MNKNIYTLFEECSAFSIIHDIITGKHSGDRFYALSRIYEIFYNHYPNEKTSRDLMHEYLKKHYNNYCTDITDAQINKIVDRKHFAVSCKKLIAEGHCKKKCKLAERPKSSPILLLKLFNNFNNVKVNIPPSLLISFFKKHKLSASEIKVLLCMISYLNKYDHTVYPSKETIAERTGIDERTVTNANKRLMKKGLIKIYKQHRKQKHPFNKYILSDEVIETFKPSIKEEERFEVSLKEENYSPTLLRQFTKDIQVEEEKTSYKD
jgi:predicted transcriptional regulator